MQKCTKCGKLTSDGLLCKDCYSLIKRNLIIKRNKSSKLDNLKEEVVETLEYLLENLAHAFGFFLKIFVGCVVLFAVIMIISKYNSYREEKRIANSPYASETYGSAYAPKNHTPKTYSTSDYTPKTYSTPTPTPNNGKSSDKIETAVNALMKSMEEQGYICSRSGYSFEQCVKAAKDHGISFNQNASFMAIVDIQTYFLCGFTTDGRNFCAEISHDKVQDNVWSVENVDYYIMN